MCPPYPRPQAVGQRRGQGGGRGYGGHIHARYIVSPPADVTGGVPGY
jgi:hypothetical protein